MMIAVPALRILDTMNLPAASSGPKDKPMIAAVVGIFFDHQTSTQRLRGSEPRLTWTSMRHFVPTMREIVIDTETTGLDPLSGVPPRSALELLRQGINYQKCERRRCSSGEASRVAGVARPVSFKR